MNRKIALINDRKYNNKNTLYIYFPIIASFGDRVYEQISNDKKYDAFITSFIKEKDDILKVRELIGDAKLDNVKTLALVDPAFADDGKLYDGVSEKHILNYKKLIEVSDIIVPNLTEACMLAGMDYNSYRLKYCNITYDGKNKDSVDILSKKVLENIFPLLEKLRIKKNQITIITGIELYNAVLTILDVYDGDHGKRQTTCNYSVKIEDRYGVGDIFNSMFFEASTNGFSLVDSLSVSTSFINNALRYSFDKKFDKNDGIIFEPILNDNIVAIKQRLNNNQNVKENK